jgi:hypothetical protein
MAWIYRESIEPGAPFQSLLVVYIFPFTMTFIDGARCSVVVEALCYKPEGRGIAS